MENMGVEPTEFSVKDLMFVQHTFLQALLIWRHTWKTVTAAASPQDAMATLGPFYISQGP